MSTFNKKFINHGDRPRLVVFRSNRYISAALIDPASGDIICSHSSKKIESKGKPVEKALETGKVLAKQILSKKISEIVFDRRNYRYHGAVKALADGLREGGLKF